MKTRIPADVLVLGTGPAGLLSALHLARSGARVQVIGRPDPRERIEGAAPRVVALLRDAGLESAAIAAPARRRVRWGDLPAAPNSEHVVDRKILERDLRELVCAAGAEVVEAEIGQRDGRAVETGAGVFRAGHVVEARGRRAPSRADALRGPASVAISGWVAAPEVRAGTSIIATELGWLWTAAAKGRLWAQVNVDAGELSGGRAGLRRVWARFFAQPGLPELPFPDAPLVRACELRLTAPELDPAALRMGDAAAALDPLSGHGMFWALSSALMLPPLLEAIDAGRGELAARFYADRVAETFWRQARIARDFHALCGEWAEAPFWAARRVWPDAEPAHPVCERPRLVRKVVVEAGRLCEADVLQTPQEPGGAAFVMGIPLGPVLRRIGPGPLPPRDVFGGLVPGISPARAGSLHDWLVSRGLPVAGPTQHQPVEMHS